MDTTTPRVNGKELFDKYERVRRSGRFNMIMDAAEAAYYAGLSIDDYCWVLNNYSELKKKYYGNK